MSRRYLIPTNMFYRENDPLPPDFPQPNEGDHYFNTVSKTIRVFYDDAWREVIPEVESPQSFHMKGATSVPSASNSQTQMVFSGASIAINTLGVVVTATTLTVPVAGWYLGALSVQQGSSGGTVRVLSLTKTGGVGRADFLNTGGDPVGGNTAGFGYQQGMSSLLYLTPDDELIMWGRQDSGSTVDMTYNLSLILVAPDDGVGGIGTGGIAIPSSGGGSGVGIAGPPFFASIRRDASYSWDGSPYVIDGWDTEGTPSSDEIVPMQWTSTGVVIPKDGVYVAMGRVQFDANSGFADARLALEISVDGADSPDEQIIRGHASNSIFHVTTTPRFYYAGAVLSVKIAVLGGPATVNMNEAKMTVVSVSGAGLEYLNPALVQQGNFTEDDFPSLASGGGTLIGSVSFIQPFKAPPFVTLEQANLPGGSQWLRWVPYNVTTTGFDIYVYNLRPDTVDLGQVGVNWRAVGSSDAKASIETEWIPVSFESGWASYSSNWGPVYYKRDQIGVVHFKGLMKPSSVADIHYDSPAFTLPEGFRPSAAGTNGRSLYMASGNAGSGVSDQGTTVRVNIDEDGTVAIEAIGPISNGAGAFGGGTPWVSMAPVSFLAEN